MTIINWEVIILNKQLLLKCTRQKRCYKSLLSRKKTFKISTLLNKYKIVLVSTWEHHIISKLSSSRVYDDGYKDKMQSFHESDCCDFGM